MLYLVLCVCAAMGRLALGQAQAPLSIQARQQPTVASVENQLADLEALEGGVKAVAEAAREVLLKALEEVKRANALTDQIAVYKADAERAPQELKAIREELALAPVAPAAPDPDTRPLTQLEQELATATAGLQTARQRVSELQTVTTSRRDRRGVIPQSIARVREQAADTGPFAGSEGEPQVMLAARRALYLARQAALTREIESLEAELAFYDSRVELLPARRDLAQRRVTEAEQLVERLQSTVTRQRQADVEQAAKEAQRLRREAAQQHPVLKQFAEDSARRAAERAGPGSISDQIDQIARRASTLRAMDADLKTRFASVQQRVGAIGLSRATGLRLRRLYDSLPDQFELRQSLRKTRNGLDNAEYELIELQEERLAAGDIDRVAQRLIAQATPTSETALPPEFELIARDLASARRDFLDQLIADQLRHREQLSSLRVAEQELLRATRVHAAYIEERILWVRSVDGDSRPSMSEVREGVAWIIDPSQWRDATSKSLAYALDHRLAIPSFTILLLAFWAFGFRSRILIRRIGDRVSRYSSDRFAYTLAALALTFVLAAPIPLALYGVGWLLERPQEQIPLGIAFGSSLQTVALMLFPLLFLRHALRAQGLGDAHFRWPPKHTRPIRRQLRWFLPIVVPCAVLVFAIDREAPEPVNATLGRSFFTIGLLALTLFLHRILRPGGPVLGQFLERNKAGALYRLRLIWHPLIVLSPIAFAVLSWFGFYYTAMRLEARFEESLVLILTLVFADAILLRWLFIARRRVAVEDARRRREQAATESDATKTSGGTPQSLAGPMDDEKVNLPAISGQTKQLFRAAITVSIVIGFYLIWSEAMPALRMAERVRLWPSIEIVDSGAETVELVGEPKVVTKPSESASAPPPTGALPGSAVEPRSEQPPGAISDEDPETIITLADAGLAVLLLVATWLAFRNVPGLLEIVLLQRLPLDAGSRYALNTVMRYLIATVGIVIAFNTIGITWGKVQWLAAALTFGLAFGLQEVFANFVSGLIILAERPIRIGDTVTVGGVSGTVSRIRMRATTIADWDRKELIIPNKTFITSEVINWTLSDQVMRVTIPVGVSYSSDPAQVERILLRIARETGPVLEDPKPQVVFKNFGDSTLDFELRVFIPSIEHFVPVRHEVNNKIIRQFRQEGVEIAFPQRDLHIRSITDLDRLVPPARPPAPDGDPA